MASVHGAWARGAVSGRFPRRVDVRAGAEAVCVGACSSPGKGEPLGALRRHCVALKSFGVFVSPPVSGSLHFIQDVCSDVGPWCDSISTSAGLRLPASSSTNPC